MSKLLRRLLSLLFTLGFYSKHYKFKYDGDITSSNKIWAGVHWSQRSAIKNKYNKIFSVLLLEAKVEPMKEMTLVVFFNTRHDVCNLSSILKVLMDTVKGKYLPDDNTKFYQASIVCFDKSLPKGEVEFHLLGN